ncbi:acyloxyacyl hydrolase [Ectothiorhodospiraceae bacterium 2226]|nr:acyloxyacyl hydrolase [Ectothiorhodospiraceae bacterium 2226]
MNRAKWGIVAAALLLAGDAAAQGPWGMDGLTVVGADSWEGEAQMQRLALHWDLPRWSVWQGSRWSFQPHLEFAVGQWEHRQRPQPGHDVGLTPVLRLARSGRTVPYVEAAVGAHLLSSPRIGGRDMSTSFQFGDLVGVGLRFGARANGEVGYRLIHFSNGGIKHPNPGINFHMVRFGYWF